MKHGSVPCTPCSSLEALWGRWSCRVQTEGVLPAQPLPAASCSGGTAPAGAPLFRAIAASFHPSPAAPLPASPPSPWPAVGHQRSSGHPNMLGRDMVLGLTELLWDQDIPITQLHSIMVQLQPPGAIPVLHPNTSISPAKPDPPCPIWT